MTQELPFDSGLFGDALDRLFAEPDEATLQAQQALAARPRIQVHLGADAIPGPPISILADKQEFLQEIEGELATVEQLLGLAPGRSCEPITSRDLPTHEEIHELLEAHGPDESPIKPDQTDPPLERLPRIVRAGEIAHGIGAIPYLVRLQRLQGASLLLRERADSVVQDFIKHYMEEPAELYMLTAQRGDADFKAASANIEAYIDGGMERMAGAHGHWDRLGRWPTALLVLQAMSLACLVRSGVQGSLRELSIMQRQFYKPDYIFLSPIIDLFYLGLKQMDVYKDVVACSNS